MSTLTKIALGLMGQLHARPARGESASVLSLRPAPTSDGLPLMRALQQRQSQRAFGRDALPEGVLSDLLWAAGGVNRPSQGGRTVPSAMNAQELDVFVALPAGLYRYEPRQHCLRLVLASDVRRITGYQEFTDEAALDLVFVADFSRMGLVPAAQREPYAYAAAGAMAQNVYLACASLGLATVVRGWIDRAALGKAMALRAEQQVLLAQTVGYPVAVAKH